MALKLTLDTSSVKEFESGLYNMLPRVHNEVAHSIEEFAQKVKAESRAQVPIDTASLFMSEYVSPPVINEKGVFIQVGYSNEESTKLNPLTGKFTDEYAVEVHENLNMPHATGNAKFLEIPLMDNRDDFLRAMISAVKTSLGG